MPAGRTKGWSERGEKGGRPKGSFKDPALKHRKVFKTFSVSCSEQEYEALKAIADSSGKTLSRMIVEKFLGV